MEKFFSRIAIRNFKSVRAVEFYPRRINIFIGKPNVGKSNLLEAISLFDTYHSGALRFMSEYLRYESIANLFYDSDIFKDVTIESNLGNGFIRRSGESEFVYSLMNEALSFEGGSTSPAEIQNYINSLSGEELKVILPFYQVFNLKGETRQSDGYGRRHVRRYVFKVKSAFSDREVSYLKPPHGDNLPAVISVNPELRKMVAKFFDEYGLELLYRVNENNFEIQKRIDGLSYTLPYSLMADTLQRMIFYLGAIKSNREAVILFEEPETHTFPTYTSLLGNEIVEDKHNQYFLTTHNPYLLTSILENSSYEETAIFKVSYKDYQTHVQMLTEEEYGYIVDNGADVFFNLKTFGSDEVQE